MFIYRTSYRAYTVAKAGFGAAYIWYVSDFFKIHVAHWNTDFPIYTAAETSPVNPLLAWLSGKIAVWTFFLASPFVISLFFFAKRRWLQCATGFWACFSMIFLNSFAGLFTTMADVWILYAFASYGIAALVQSDAAWAEAEPGFNPARWKENPTLDSTYAWLVVLLQFTVYFFAGVAKLEYGWDAWTRGYALQNLAYDTSMRDFVRGLHVSHWLSLALCYFTLFQRLVVPFGFYFKRYRIWSVLILGSMHIGYAMLMRVNLFPVIGLSCLAMVVPPRHLESSTPAPGLSETIRERTPSVAMFRHVVLILFSGWLLLEPVRLSLRPPMRLENNLMLVPAWKMFSDGGATAGDGWRLILQTPAGDVDATGIATGLLPQLWRDRFYLDDVLHEIFGQHTGPGTLPDRLAKATVRMYKLRQILAKGDPAVLNSTYQVYSINPRYMTDPQTAR